MEPGARSASGHLARIVVVSACAASAGAHAALVSTHLEDRPALGVAFLAAAALALAASAGVAMHPSSGLIASLAALLLAALIAAYVLSVTTGIAGGPEPVDPIGVVTKAVEALGLLFALQLVPTRSGRGSLTRQEARP